MDRSDLKREIPNRGVGEHHLLLHCERRQRVCRGEGPAGALWRMWRQPLDMRLRELTPPRRGGRGGHGGGQPKQVRLACRRSEGGE